MNKVEGQELGEAYLQKVLSLLDLKLLIIVRKIEYARTQASRDNVNIPTVSEVENLLLQFSGSPEGSNEKLPDDENEFHKNALLSLRNDIKKIRDEALLHLPLTGLLRIQELFGLNEEELSAFAVCCAAALDNRYGKIFAYINDNSNNPYPSGDLLATIMGGESASRLDTLHFLQEDDPLRKFDLIEPAYSTDSPGPLQTYFKVPRSISAWLNKSWNTGIYNEIYRSKLIRKEDIPTDFPNSEFNFINIPLSVTEPNRLFSFYGKDSQKQTAAAADTALRLGKNLLITYLNSSIAPADRPDQLRAWIRDAALLDAVLVLNNADQWNNQGKKWDESLTSEILDLKVPVILNSEKIILFTDSNDVSKIMLYRIQFTDLSAEERSKIWKNALDAVENYSETAISAENLQRLSGQFKLTSSQIYNAVSSAAASAEVKNQKISIEDLYEGARISSVHNLDELAVKLEPRYKWNDLILPVDQTSNLEEMIAMARNRAKVFEEWGVGKRLASGSGISALFTGEPGTGKTMAACVMAAALGIDIYRIDLSTVVSKYVGETEKNLEKIFSNAQSSNVILFFDEADSLFGKRSEVHEANDRYANIEVGYLLQRFESYDGIAILATNLSANLDEAFTRRIHFIIDFPFPDEKYRLKLWESMIPEKVPTEGNLELSDLAKRFRISGGSIRNAIVNAVFMAAEENQPLSHRLLLRGVRREYQKMGKVFQDDMNE